MKFHPLFLALPLLSIVSAVASAQKTIPPASFKSGETFFYRIHLKIDRDIKTKSALSLPQTPMEANIDVQGILQVDVLPRDASSPAPVHLRTWFLALISDLSILPRGAKPGDGTGQRVPAKEKFIDCTLEPSGEIDQIVGLDALAPEQQQAWQEWAARFAAPFLIESQNRKRGEKWSSEELETTPSPLADLRWQKKSQYVRDEPCFALRFARNAEFQNAPNSQSCATVISTATLQQKSSPQDATPPDYKQHALRTRGVATGNNDVILSISRKTGQLVRATQNAKQHMDVVIALASGATKVHYDINATARSSVELVTDLPLMLQPNPPK